MGQRWLMFSLVTTGRPVRKESASAPVRFMGRCWWVALGLNASDPVGIWAGLSWSEPSMDLSSRVYWLGMEGSGPLVGLCAGRLV